MFLFGSMGQTAVNILWYFCFATLISFDYVFRFSSDSGISLLPAESEWLSPSLSNALLCKALVVMLPRFLRKMQLATVEPHILRLPSVLARLTSQQETSVLRCKIAHFDPSF